MSESATPTRLELARDLAWTAGRKTLDHFQSNSLAVERKADQSPVTIADRECEAFIRREIERLFPDDGIVGEEYGVKDGSNEFRWILDPIDGTKSFVSGVPLFGTMVAVERDSVADIGVVYIPGLDEGVFAKRGEGCWYRRQQGDAERTTVSDCQALDRATLVTTEYESFEERDADEAFRALAGQVAVARTWGDCYGYVLVATGRAEVMIDPILNIWDAAAVQPIIIEAGGMFTDWQGTPAIDSGDAIGSNGFLHEAVLEALS